MRPVPSHLQSHRMRFRGCFLAESYWHRQRPARGTGGRRRIETQISPLFCKFHANRHRGEFRASGRAEEPAAGCLMALPLLYTLTPPRKYTQQGTHCIASFARPHESQVPVHFAVAASSASPARTTCRFARDPLVCARAAAARRALGRSAADVLQLGAREAMVKLDILFERCTRVARGWCVLGQAGLSDATFTRWLRNLGVTARRSCGSTSTTRRQRTFPKNLVSSEISKLCADPVGGQAKHFVSLHRPLSKAAYKLARGSGTGTRIAPGTPAWCVFTHSDIHSFSRRAVH